MFLMLSRILSRSNCILILIIFDLASSAPLKSRKRSPFQREQGFSASPKILEIQLPLKISSKEDLAAWSKYVTSLMASKINFMSTTSKNSPSVEKRVPLNNSGSKSKEMMKKAFLNEKRPGLNYPARRLKEPHMQRADDKVVAYPLPMGAMKMTASSPQDPSSLPTSNINGPTDFEQYTDFNIGNPFQQSEIDNFGNFDILAQPPAPMYLPSPLRTTDTAKSYQSAVDKNISGFEEPVKLQTTRNFLNLLTKAHDNELGQVLPIAVNDGLIGRNLSHLGEPLLTFPFQAVITITKELPEATTILKTHPIDYNAINTRDPFDGLLPYFEKNYTLMNESGQVNVVLSDFTAGTGRAKTKGNVKTERQEDEDEKQNTQKKQNEKKTKNAKKQKSAIKRQSSILGDLLRMLGILRKLPKNTTEVNVATPILSILKGTNPQKIQVAFEETPPPPPPRGRRNETLQAQQLDDDDEDENEEEPQTEAQEEEEEEEEEGGSIQAIIDLLPLAAPVLEDLSDPESDVDIAEVLQGAIPLLEGLSDPDEEGGIDIPGVLVPLSQRLSEGPDGQGSDSGAILGPLIQLIAPLIGPLSGPLIGPLSRTSSGPGGKEGSASIFSAASAPLSQPQGAYGQSVLSGLIASITARLSKVRIMKLELAASAGESDVKSLVSSIVSGVLAGASAGSSGHKQGYKQTYNGHKDTYYAPTTYGSYGSYGSKPQVPGSNDFINEILGAFLKLSATSSTSSANLSGTSSSSSTGLSASSSESSQEPPKPTYGAPTNPPYAPASPPSRPAYTPSAYTPPESSSSPYVSFTRRQVARQRIKKF